MCLVTACAVFSACTPGQDEISQRTLVAGAPLEVEESPYLAVGEALGDTIQEFFRVVTPFLLPDGRLVVPVSGGDAIRIFGPDGRYLATLGRRGEGPGEFQGLSSAWPRGDTIEAYDARLTRITRFLPDGSVEVVPLRAPLPMSSVPGALPDGWLLVGIAGAAPSGRDRMEYHHFARDGAHLGVFAEVEGMHRWSIPGFTGPDPLSPMGRGVVSGGSVYLAETFAPNVRRFDPQGVLQHEFEWEPEVPLSPEAAFRTIVDSAVARVEDELATRQRLEAFPVRDRVPVFWDLMVDAEGFVWVQPFEPGKHSMVLSGGSRPDGDWWVFSPEGIRTGSVTVPEGLRISQITKDAVVGISQDALGVESVRVHRLQRN